jgi:hypothetical protein
MALACRPFFGRRFSGHSGLYPMTVKIILDQAYLSFRRARSSPSMTACDPNMGSFGAKFHKLLYWVIAASSKMIILFSNAAHIQA